MGNTQHAMTFVRVTYSTDSTEGYNGPLGGNTLQSEWRCNRKPASRTVTPLQFISYLLPPPH